MYRKRRYAIVRTIFIVLFLLLYLPIPYSRIRPSTVERTRVIGAVPDYFSRWFQDDLEVIEDPEALQAGLQYFYVETGCVPYLWITDTLAGESPFINAVDLEFQQENPGRFRLDGHNKFSSLNLSSHHLLFTFYVDPAGEWKLFVVYGRDTVEFYDRESLGILGDFLRLWDKSSVNFTGVFVNSFVGAADYILTVTPPSFSDRLFTLFCLTILSSFLFQRRSSLLTFIRNIFKFLIFSNRKRAVKYMGSL